MLSNTLMSMIEQKYDVFLRKSTLLSLGTHVRNPRQNSQSTQQALKKYRKPYFTFLCTEVCIPNDFAAVTNSGWRRR